MTMLVKLENYYRERGIYPAAGADFGCKCAEHCRGELEFTPLNATLSSSWRNTFTPGHSAFVGACYEDAVPRLLFVALDLGTVLRPDDLDYNYVPPENRAPLGIRRSHERMMGLIACGKDKARRPTLKGTNRLAKSILQNLPGIPEGEDFMRFCTRVNAAKCTVNKEGRRQADNRLYDNCRERNYLREEIEILAPHIIVSLGEMAKKAVESAFSISSEWAREQTVALRDGKEAVWFPSYHPSSYGPYKSQEEQREQFVRTARGRVNKLIRR